MDQHFRGCLGSGYGLGALLRLIELRGGILILKAWRWAAVLKEQTWVFQVESCELLGALGNNGEDSGTLGTTSLPTLRRSPL